MTPEYHSRQQCQKHSGAPIQSSTKRTNRRRGGSCISPRVDILTRVGQREAGGIDPNSVLDNAANISRQESKTTPSPHPPTATSASILSLAAPVTRESLAVAASVAQRRTQGIVVEGGLKRTFSAAFASLETNDCNAVARQHRKRRQAGGVSAGLCMTQGTTRHAKNGPWSTGDSPQCVKCEIGHCGSGQVAGEGSASVKVSNRAVAACLETFHFLPLGGTGASAGFVPPIRQPRTSRHIFYAT